ncbi:hypothetical protein EAO75_13860 [Streptomyces sp. uw30]|nr:hypothetical protein EAO75_13860 [Streptomyces sp. uw30]
MGQPEQRAEGAGPFTTRLTWHLPVAVAARPATAGATAGATATSAGRQPSMSESAASFRRPREDREGDEGWWGLRSGTTTCRIRRT